MNLALGVRMQRVSGLKAPITPLRLGLETLLSQGKLHYLECHLEKVYSCV